MAGKRKPTTAIDDAGYETDGMYRWGGPRKKHTADEIKKLLDAMVDDHHQPAVERIREIREWLNSVIAPHVDGPHDPDVLRRGGEWGRMVHLDLSTGKGLYQVADDAPKHGYVADAIDALRENFALEHTIERGGSINEIVRLAIRQGMSIERIEKRMIFAPLVLSEVGRRKGAKRGGAKSAKWTPEVEGLARSIFAEVKTARVSDDAAYRRTVARLKTEHNIEVSKDTLKRHLGQPPAQQ